MSIPPTQRDILTSSTSQHPISTSSTSKHPISTPSTSQHDPPPSVRSSLVLRPFLLWLVLWLVGCLWGVYLSLSPMDWGICALLSICAALWAWWSAQPYTMLALCVAAFGLGGLSPRLAASRQAHTMDPITPPLLAKRLFYEGVLLQPLQPRVVPPYRYPIPKRHLRHPVGTCSHPPHPSERITTDQATHVGSAAFLLRRWSDAIHGPWRPIHEKDPAANRR